MRNWPWVLFFLLCGCLPEGKAQGLFGVSGGGGLPNQVLFRGAVPVELPLGKNIRIQAEAAFVQRENPSVLVKLQGPRNYLKPVINYLEFPVLLKIGLPFEFFDFYFFTGPQLGYGVGLSSTFEEDNLLYVERLDFDRTRIGRLDAGISVGIGVEKTISQGRRIFIDLRYYLGLRNINLESGEQIFNEGRSFALGLMIPFQSPKSEAGGRKKAQFRPPASGLRL